MVSIIIPNFNSHYTIADTLNSLLAQSSTDWECIIIDDENKLWYSENVEALLD